MSADVAPELSVILCSRNGERTIADQLDALAGQDIDRPWEILLVDNGSTDSTVAVFEATTFPTVARVIDASTRPGLAHARNQGVAAARAPQVAFCDDDDVVAESWASAMLDALGTHPIVAPAFEYERLNASDTSAGRTTFQASKLETLFGMPVCAGACGVRVDVWNLVGGNDEALLATGEDFDFVLRARAHGIEPVFEPRAIYHLRLRDDPDAVWGQAKAYGASQAMLWSRHGDGRALPPDELRRAAKDWWWILTRAPISRDASRRATWARRAGRRFGRLQGSFRHRVFAP